MSRHLDRSSTDPIRRDPAPNPGRGLKVAVAAGVGAVALWLAWDRAGGTRDTPRAPVPAREASPVVAGGSPAPASAAAGVSPRPADAANHVREEYVRDPSRRDRYRAALKGGDLLDPQAPSETANLELRLALLDPVTAYGDEESCRARFADWPAGSACEVRLELVVERTESEGGVVAYARGHAGPEAPAACQDFARCMAGARLGRRVPLRAGLALQPVAHTSTFPANADRTCDADALRGMQAAMRADLEAAGEIPAGELPDGAFRTAFQQRLLDYLELRIRDCTP